MTRPQFYRNTYLEFPLMLDLAAEATTAWGAAAVSSLGPSLVDTLVRVRPAQNGMFEHGRWETLPRSTAEHGSDWLSDPETTALLDRVRALPANTMTKAWNRLAVRVMAARDYNYVGGDSFYDPEMRDKAAVEGTLHVLLAGDGARYVFPHMGHNKIFTATEAITQCIIEIDDAATRLNTTA
jgi:hypothetical protein